MEWWNDVQMSKTTVKWWNDVWMSRMTVEWCSNELNDSEMMEWCLNEWNDIKVYDNEDNFDNGDNMTSTGNWSTHPPFPSHLVYKWVRHANAIGLVIYDSRTRCPSQLANKIIRHCSQAFVNLIILSSLQRYWYNEMM